jgi:hypothetical protein
MGTPGQPERGLIPSLYGESGGVINHGLSAISRRAVLGVALALPVAARAGGFEADLLDRVIAAAGGRALLSRVKALNWTGSAQVFVGDQTLAISVKTRVEPFVRAKSESALVGKPESGRMLIIEPDGGFVERVGVRTALPARQTEHERQQYGVYGYLLLALAPAHLAGDRIVSERPGLPPISFLTEGDYLVAADYNVSSPDSDATINQRFIFEGEMPDKGIHWPRTITILQNDKPYFILDLDTFSVELT